MLSVYPAGHGDAAHPPPGGPGSCATWFDLFDPTAEERAQVEQATRLRLPSREDLDEIESTSRHYVENHAIYMSTPLVNDPGGPSGGLTSAGFILSPKVLISLRYERVGAMGEVLKTLKDAEDLCSSDVFTRVMEAVVDRSADLLEHVGNELDRCSREAFRGELSGKPRPKQENPLRRKLRELGQLGDRLSQVRDALHGVGRLAPFVAENAKAWMPDDVRGRLGAVRDDITSLNDYEGHLSTKVQFLLDAVLGFISIEQNDVVKVLTIVSVVGVPPVLVAGVYGMNFHVMPELAWRYGYPFSLVLMVVSGLLPLVWFKWRGWM